MSDKISWKTRLIGAQDPLNNLRLELVAHDIRRIIDKFKF